MKKYKYTFPLVATILLFVGNVIALLCIGWNVIRFAGFISENIKPTTYNYLSLILAVLLSIAYMVISLVAFFNSYYYVDGKKVVLKWGILKNEINLFEVTQIKLLTLEGKLQLVFEDESFFNIATKKEWFEDFVNEIKSANPKIVFVQVSEKELDKK